MAGAVFKCLMVGTTCFDTMCKGYLQRDLTIFVERFQNVLRSISNKKTDEQKLIHYNY